MFKKYHKCEFIINICKYKYILTMTNYLSITIKNNPYSDVSKLPHLPFLTIDKHKKWIYVISDNQNLLE